MYVDIQWKERSYGVSSDNIRTGTIQDLWWDTGYDILVINEMFFYVFVANVVDNRQQDP